MRTLFVRLQLSIPDPPQIGPSDTLSQLMANLRRGSGQIHIHVGVGGNTGTQPAIQGNISPSSQARIYQKSVPCAGPDLEHWMYED